MCACLQHAGANLMCCMCFHVLWQVVSLRNMLVKKHHGFSSKPEGKHACRNQPVWRTRLLFGTAAAVLVGAHHNGMTVGINSK